MARPLVSAWTRVAVIAWFAVLLLSLLSYVGNWGASKAIFRALTEGGCLLAVLALLFLVGDVARTIRARRNGE